VLTGHQNPYQAAIQGAAYSIVSSSGYLRIHGEDRLAFLQRQTSNDLRLAQEGRAVLTVLTTPAARILDVLYVLLEPDALGVITLPGHGESTARYLKSRIFFMDKVTLVEASAELAQIDLMGPQAPGVLAHVGVDLTLQPNQVAGAILSGASSLRALALEPSFGLGVRLLFPSKDIAALQAFLAQAGALQLQDEDYSILRLEAGLPAAGAELSEEYTPLEAGLHVAISSSKGCYTGQEVIARQLTYDKVTQHLCGLRLARRAAPGERLWSANGSPVGRITSAASSPRFGEIALAVVKRPHHDPGSDLWVGEAFETAAQVQVAALPFRDP
jgi:folate-binding protein YgfZ